MFATRDCVANKFTKRSEEGRGVFGSRMDGWMRPIHVTVHVLMYSGGTCR